MKPPVIRILIVDSQPLVRRAWRALFTAHSDFEVVAEAVNLTSFPRLSFTLVALAITCLLANVEIMGLVQGTFATVVPAA